MSRVPSSQPPADAPYYRYDPHLGSPRDKYQRVDYRLTAKHQPEQPARFAALVEGETVLMSMWGRRTVSWRAEPGTPCLILGHWSDGTVHLKWPGLRGNYMIDGRFPAWVAKEDPDAQMAGGGFMLLANELVAVPKEWSPRLVLLVAMLILIIVLLLIPATREGLASLFFR